MDAVMICLLIMAVCLLISIGGFLYWHGDSFGFVVEKKKRDAAKLAEAKKFYLLCQKAGITSFATSEDKVRINQLAREHNIKKRNNKLFLWFDEGRLAVEAADAKRKARAEAAKAKEDSRKPIFYRACVKAGVTGANTEADHAAIQRVAKERRLDKPLDELILFFEQGKVMNMEQELQKLREKEKAMEASTRKYLQYSGNQKTIAYYEELFNAESETLAKLEAEEKTVRDLGIELCLSGTQKEYDWAVHGGIASAIAGPAAGMATALDIQRKNAEIRESNAAVLQASALFVVQATSGIVERKAETRKKVLLYSGKIADAQRRPLDESVPAEQLLSQLSLTVKKCTRSKSGAIYLDIRVKNAEMIICKKVPAIIDGHIKAVLLNDETKFGEAVFSLPVEAHPMSATVRTICLGPVPENTDYRVEFEPINLWLCRKG